MLSEEQSPDDWDALLCIAKEAVLAAANGRRPAALPSADLPPRLLEDGAVFVTLTKSGQLRGCIGSLAAIEPLAEGVRRNAVNAAFHDYRFAPLTAAELPELHIEVSVLSEPQPLTATDADDLVRRLRPGVDGVILQGPNGEQATFLPQVWQQLKRPELFLDHLCRKAGLPGDAWRSGRLRVFTYQVQSFEEPR